MSTQIYDAIVIGGGPAGESAAIYLARFNRKTLVIDRGGGRTQSYELNENYLGFPFGIKAQKLTELGKTQAERFGAKFVDDEVTIIRKTDFGFALFSDQHEYHTRAVILASGVTDLYPNFPDFRDYLGKSVFWCITCDGHKTINKRVLIVGDSDDAACTALQFLVYTPHVTLLSNYEKTQEDLKPIWRQRLSEHQIPVYDSVIKHISGENGWIKTVELENGEHIATDFLFNLQGAVPNNSLACQLGVFVNSEGYIEATEEQRTNVPFFYAAGDVTRMFAHQIATAVHEGSMAGQACNYDLYEEYQRT